MNRENRITPEQLAQAKPYKPACQANDFAADKLRVLEQAGAAGLTTRELMDRGGGMRPPNRIHDLREEGHAIQTRPEGRGVYRFVLCKFLPKNEAVSSEGTTTKTNNLSQPHTRDLETLPLFSSVTRR